MYDRTLRGVSRSKVRAQFAKLLAATAMLPFVNQYVASAAACDQCNAQMMDQGSCQTCSTCSGPAKRKPFSILQLGSLVDGVDRMTDSFERSLVGRSSASCCDGEQSCDSCTTAVDNNTLWEMHTPSVAIPSRTESHAVAPKKTESEHARMITTPPSSEQSHQVSPFADDSDTLPSVPSQSEPVYKEAIEVPASAPAQDYQHDPFRDDTRIAPQTKSKVVNRYKVAPTSGNASQPNVPAPKPLDSNARNMRVSQPESRFSATGYSHAYRADQFIEAQKSMQRAKELAKTIPLPKEPKQASVQTKRTPEFVPATPSIPKVASTPARSSGIRIKVASESHGNTKPVAEAQPAVYQAMPQSNDTVRPASAIQLAD